MFTAQREHFLHPILKLRENYMSMQLFFLELIIEFTNSSKKTNLFMILLKLLILYLEVGPGENSPMTDFDHR